MWNGEKMMDYAIIQAFCFDVIYYSILSFRSVCVCERERERERGVGSELNKVERTRIFFCMDISLILSFNTVCKKLASEFI